jgi:hypothetical protein
MDGVRMLFAIGMAPQTAPSPRRKCLCQLGVCRSPDIRRERETLIRSGRDGRGQPRHTPQTWIVQYGSADILLRLKCILHFYLPRRAAFRPSDMAIALACIGLVTIAPFLLPLCNFPAENSRMTFATLRPPLESAFISEDSYSSDFYLN